MAILAREPRAAGADEDEVVDRKAGSIKAIHANFSPLPRRVARLRPSARTKAGLAKRPFRSCPRTKNDNLRDFDDNFGAKGEEEHEKM